MATEVRPRPRSREDASTRVRAARRNRRPRGTTSNFSKWRAGRSFDRRSFDTRTTRATRAPLRSPRRRLARRWWTPSDPCGLAPWWRVPPNAERRAWVFSRRRSPRPCASGATKKTNTRRCLCPTHRDRFPRRRSLYGCVRSLGFCGSSNTAIRRRRRARFARFARSRREPRSGTDPWRPRSRVSSPNSRRSSRASHRRRRIRRRLASPRDSGRFREYRRGVRRRRWNSSARSPR